MQHQPDVRSIDTHPERHRGNQHGGLSLKEMFQCPMPHVWLKTGVICNGMDTACTEPFGPLLNRPSGARVDQAGAMRLLKRLNDVWQGILCPPTHGVVQILSAR